MKGRSLKLRLTAAAGLSAAAALITIAFLLVSGFDRHLTTQAKDELGHQLDQLAALFLLDEQGKPILEADLSDPRYERPLSGLYWQIDGDGGALLRSRSLWDKTLQTADGLSGDQRLVETAGPGDAPVLALSRDVTLRDQSAIKRQFRLTVALDSGEITRMRAEMLGPVLLGLAFAGLALVGAGWAQIGFGLKPLEAMRQELERVRMGSAQQLSLEAFPIEIMPLADEINTLLEGHQGLVDRARRRAGDLAHGLKTPLAALAAQADLLASRGDGDSAAAIRRQIQTMQAHVERELALARSQGGKLAIGSSASPLKEIQSAIDVLKKLPADRDLEWSISGEDAAIAMAADDVAEVVGNLLDNGRKWAKSRVAASIRRKEDGIHIQIEDDGPGIPPQLMMRGMERGARLDEAVPGTGLGLSIVTSILETYGLKLELEKSASGGLAARFVAPPAAKIQR